MAIYKCKMCGGDLEIQENQTVVECEYCGSKQTVPNIDNEKKANLFARANRLRMKYEFDKAATVYESIIAEFPEESEAYWGVCLCKYGIEYVDDPVTARKVPTCHRTSYESIFKDENFELALEYADAIAVRVYRDEAKEIDRLQKAILEIVNNEEPYDIFICYKETDEDGKRTPDSVYAQDIYSELTKKRYKVFFSRITLEDKLGEQYEPYIFSALNSAKVMLSIGTKYEYFNATWVKNEWSRYLEIIKADSSKKLIPCYKDIDAYDMPDEFSNLQGQDMNKLGFLQDLIRGIDKILDKPTETKTQEQNVVINNQNSQTSALIKRGYMALEDKEWENADHFFDDALNYDAENAEAYLGKFLANIECYSLSNFSWHCTYLYDRGEDNLDSILFEKEFEDANEFISKISKEYEVPHFYENSEIDENAVILKAKLEIYKQNHIKIGKYLDHKLLFRAIQFSSNSLKDEIKSTINNIKECDNNKLLDSEKEFNEYLSDYEKKLSKNYDDAIKKREEYYQYICSLEIDEDSIKLKDELENARIILENYKDSESIIQNHLLDLDHINKVIKQREDEVYFLGHFDEIVLGYKDSYLNECNDLKEELFKCYKENNEFGNLLLIELENQLSRNEFVFEEYNKLNDDERIDATNFIEKEESLVNQRVSLEQKIDNLGAFAGKQKKNIKNDIDAIDKKLDILSKIKSINQLTVNEDSSLWYIANLKYEIKNNKKVVSFGNYEWKVLRVEQDKALICSIENLFPKMYNFFKNSPVRWNSCDVRKFLNEKFYSTFSNEEQQIILTTLNKKLNSFDVDSEDKIFILSFEEVEEYFLGDHDYCYCWLRYSDLNHCAGTADWVYSATTNVRTVKRPLRREAYIRPAMWIKLD